MSELADHQPGPVGLSDPGWVFRIPRFGAPADEVERWIAEVADDIEGRRRRVAELSALVDAATGGNGPAVAAISRSEAEQSARRMLARSWRECSLVGPVKYGIDRWLSESSDDIELYREVPRAEAERLARIELKKWFPLRRRLRSNFFIVEYEWPAPRPVPRHLCRRQREGRYFISSRRAGFV
jgi:hypothetical protein